MAVSKKNLEKLVGATTDQPVEPITEKNIAGFEMQAMQEASKAISVLEAALAGWESSEDKPEDLVPVFKSYQWLRDSLSEWMTMMLRTEGEKIEFLPRLERLMKYVKIFRAFENGQVR